MFSWRGPAHLVISYKTLDKNWLETYFILTQISHCLERTKNLMLCLQLLSYVNADMQCIFIQNKLFLHDCILNFVMQLKL